VGFFGIKSPSKTEFYWRGVFLSSVMKG